VDRTLNRLLALGYRPVAAVSAPLFAVSTLAPVVQIERHASASVGIPSLWRYLAWAVVAFVMCGIGVGVRLDAQQLRKDIDRNGRLQREARVANERLRLELDARRRAHAMSDVAAALSLGPSPEVVRVQLPELAGAASVAGSTVRRDGGGW
jgi:hypothetical protein